MSARELITEHLDLWTGAVTKKSSSGRGSNGKVELTGIKKLRELILELAIRGQLLKTQSVASEEPSESYGVTRHKVGNEDYPFLKPRNWSFAKFIDVLDFQGGGQPPKSMFSQEQRDGYVQLLQIRDLGPNPQPVYVPEGSVSKFCTEDDILIGRYGASVGKVFWGKPGAYNVALIKLINKHGLYFPAFLYHLMTSPYGQSLFVGISRSAQSGFSKKDVANRVLPLPPIAEQYHIVQKVDELMALCDRLEQQTSDQLEAHETLVDTLLGTLTQSENAAELADNWARLAAHFDTLFTTEQSIDKLKQTILQLAVMGRLVEQDAEDEGTESLIGKIDLEIDSLVRQGRIKKPKVVTPVADSDKLFEIPRSWQLVRLGSLALHSEAGWSPKCHDTPREGQNWGVLKVSAVTWGQFRPEENKELPVNLAPRPEYEVSPSDFLISRANTAELVARSVVVPEGAPSKLMMSDKIIRFVFSKEVEPLFLNLFNNSPFARNYYLSVAGGTSSSMKNVSRAQIQMLVVPLPPKVEQTRIVQKVDKLMALCDQLKERLNQASQTRCQLAEAVVEGALN